VIIWYIAILCLTLLSASAAAEQVGVRPILSAYQSESYVEKKQRGKEKQGRQITKLKNEIISETSQLNENIMKIPRKNMKL